MSPSKNEQKLMDIAEHIQGATGNLRARFEAASAAQQANTEQITTLKTQVADLEGQIDSDQHQQLTEAVAQVDQTNEDLSDEFAAIDSALTGLDEVAGIIRSGDPVPPAPATMPTTRDPNDPGADQFGHGQGTGQSQATSSSAQVGAVEGGGGISGVGGSFETGPGTSVHPADQPDGGQPPAQDGDLSGQTGGAPSSDVGPTSTTPPDVSGSSATPSTGGATSDTGTVDTSGAQTQDGTVQNPGQGTNQGGTDDEGQTI